MDVLVRGSAHLCVYAYPYTCLFFVYLSHEWHVAHTRVFGGKGVDVQVRVSVHMCVHAYPYTCIFFVYLFRERHVRTTHVLGERYGCASAR